MESMSIQAVRERLKKLMELEIIGKEGTTKDTKYYFKDPFRDFKK